MEEIIKLLMERDNISRDEAIRRIDETRELLSLVEDDIFEACEIFYEILGLDLIQTVKLLGLDSKIIDKILDF